MILSLSKTFVAALAVAAVHAYPQPRHTPVENEEFLESLTTAPTVIRKYRRVLTKNAEGQEIITGKYLAEATTLDFTKEENMMPVPGGQGGKTSMIGPDTFPILLGTGIVTNVATIGPCGLLAPHVHPRANEFFLVIDGEVDFGYMLESGLLKDNAPVPEITGKLTKLVGTLFPQGSVHFQINNSCKETTIVASLSSDDPGTTPILRKTGGNSKGNDNGNMVSRAVGRDDFEPLRPLLPDSIVETIEQCFERCNIA